MTIPGARRVRRALPAVLLAAAPSARAAVPAAVRAREVEADLALVSVRLAAQDERFVLESLPLAGIAAALDRFAPDSAAARRARADALRVLEAQKAPRAELALKAAVLAEELRVYKETGVLKAPDAATVARFRHLFLNPEEGSGARRVPDLSLDLMVLQKQLGLKPESFPRTAAAPPRAQAPAAARAPRFEDDAGTGRMETDPVPGLISQLSDPSPRKRAWAADGLGDLGTASAAAVPALRKALNDPAARVRAGAARALGAVAPAAPETVADLRRALGDKDAEVRLDARAALKLLGAAPAR